MEPREFVETRMRRYMAQTLEEFEEKLEIPLRNLHGSLSNGVTSRHIGCILDDADGVKRMFRRKLQAFAEDCVDLMPSDLEINAFEPVIRR